MGMLRNWRAPRYGRSCAIEGTLEKPVASDEPPNAPAWVEVIEKKWDAKGYLRGVLG
jgi:hypothetical protein